LIAQSILKLDNLDLLELLLLVVSEAVLLLVVTLVAGVVPVVVLILVGGVKFLILGAINNEVSGVTVLEAAPGLSPPLLVELVQSNLIVGDALVLLIRSYS
jgi:hypothetical protein